MDTGVDMDLLSPRHAELCHSNQIILHPHITSDHSNTTTTNRTIKSYNTPSTIGSMREMNESANISYYDGLYGDLKIFNGLVLDTSYHHIPSNVSATNNSLMAAAHHQSQASELNRQVDRDGTTKIFPSSNKYLSHPLIDKINDDNDDRNESQINSDMKITSRNPNESSTKTDRFLWAKVGQIESIYQTNNIINNMIVGVKNNLWPKARHGHRMVSLAERFCIMYGGALNDGTFDNIIYVYDALKRYWFIPKIKETHKPPGLSAFGICTDSKRFVYIYGGISEKLRINSSIYILDCMDWKWQKVNNDSFNDTQASKNNQSVDKEINNCGLFGCSLNYYNGNLILYGGIGIDKFQSQNNLMYYSNRFCVIKCYKLHRLAKKSLNYSWDVVNTKEFPLKARESHTALIWGHNLYIFGGTNIQRLPCSWKIDLERWKCEFLGNFTSQGIGKAMHSSTIIRNYVYHFGGLDQDSILSTSSNLESNTSITPLDHNNQQNPKNDVFVFNNASQLEYYALNDVQNKVCAAEYPNKIKPRSNHASCAIGSRLFIMGGRKNSPKRSHNNESFITETKTQNMEFKDGSEISDCVLESNLLSDMYYLDVSFSEAQFKTMIWQERLMGDNNDPSKDDETTIFLQINSQDVDCNYFMVVAFDSMPQADVRPELIPCSIRLDGHTEKNASYNCPKAPGYIQLRHYYDFEKQQSKILHNNRKYYIAIYPFNNFGMGKCSLRQFQAGQVENYFDPRQIKVSLDNKNVILSWKTSSNIIYACYGFDYNQRAWYIDQTQEAQIKLRLADLLDFFSKTSIGYILNLGISCFDIPLNAQNKTRHQSIKEELYKKLPKSSFESKKRIVRLNIHIF